ncbi:ATPase, T2SS/T4P/T4SS family [Geminicoccaceae bacterium 1502E]|nr:ATPase, T2SS/T4P/T4SS family [Geminicoccaceae bacterium 1502E]
MALPRIPSFRRPAALPSKLGPTGSNLAPTEGVVLHPVLQRLVERDRLDLTEARRAMLAAAEGLEPLPALLARLGLVNGALWAATAAEVSGLRHLRAEDFPEQPPEVAQLSARFLRQVRLAPLAVEDGRLLVATADPADSYGLKALQLAAGLPVDPAVASPEDIEAALARWHDGRGAALQRIVDDLGVEPGEAGGDVDRLKDIAQEAPVVRLVNQLLSDALRMRASDIHIEPFRDHLRVRFRVHGRLREIAAPPAHLAAAVVSRIKILARLDIAERRLPQDGRARLQLQDKRVDLRVATAPTMHGESLVIRLLDTSDRGAAFDELGLGAEVEKRFARQLASPHGMILVTGPTGSGKTTTLYAALRQLNRDSEKIISIEDPVEYQIDGIAQIQVRPEIGLDFARVLRSVVRHDPNIVMVGETRDAETAEIAVHAALTGHLLLTTLHTNSAAGAVARLLDMGVEPYLLASVLRGVVGQRLVGILCPHCKQAHEAEPEERQFFTEAGIATEGPVTLYREQGCPKCEQVGFVGRIGIFEFLEVDDAVRELVRQRASTQQILQAALQRGMRTMFVDGLGKALAGQTTLEEVRRVTEDW